MNINITIANKHCTVEGTPVIVCGNADYTMTFAFDAEWDQAAERTARFSYVRDGVRRHQDVELTGDTVAVPAVYKTRELQVGVYAGGLVTSTPARIPCEKSIACDTCEPEELFPGPYAQLRKDVDYLTAHVDAQGIVASASGSLICLTDCLNVPTPIKGLKAWVMARQEGEGTPSAENVRPIIPYEGSRVTIGIDSTEDMPNPTLYSSGTLPANMYGGYVDWARGVFVQTHEYIVVDGTAGSYVMYANSGNSGWFYATDVLQANKDAPGSADSRQNTGFCDSFIYKKDDNLRSLYFTKRNLWFSKVDGCNSVEKLVSYLKEHPAHIVYPLETPIEHPLADMPNAEILLTDAPCYVGTDGSKMEIDYVADTKAYIDNKFNELATALVANS